MIRTLPQRLWRQVFITRNYALFMAGSFVSALGSWFQGVAIGWLVLELTGSPAALGLASFAQMGPAALLALFGGALSDRFDRRRLLLAGVTTGACATATLALLALTGRASMPAILACGVVMGAANAVVWPTMLPFLKELVPPDRVREAIAYNSARFNLTRVLGPALAGIAMARIGAPACLAIAAVSSAGVLGATWFIRRPTNRRRRGQPIFSAIQEGFAYVWHDGFSLRLLLTTAGFGMLALAYQPLLPAFAREVLGWDAQGLGVLLTAVGGGAIMAAVLSGTPFVTRRPGVCMAAAALLTGIGLLLFGLAVPGGALPVWAGTVGVAIAGFGSIGYLTTANATLQVRVPERLTGRVMSLWVLVNAGSMPLGGVLLGRLAEHVGLPAVMLGAGAAGLATGALTLLMRTFAGSRDQPARARGTSTGGPERIIPLAERLEPRPPTQLNPARDRAAA